MTKCDEFLTVGQCSSCDSGLQHALHRNTCVVVIRDMFTMFGYAYASSSKNTDSVVRSTQPFAGDENVARIYCANADELVAAARYLLFPREASQQGLSHY